MMSEEKIEHTGIVSKITDKSMIVNMLVSSACGSCESKGHCGVAESEIKQVEIPSGNTRYKTGDQVVVRLDKSRGMLAMILGYILPFILMMIVLVISSQVSGNEVLSGLLSIGILLPYYLILYLIRNKLKQKFTFTLKQLN